jgi:hypothetical protein
MVWIGAEASVGERRHALNFGVQYLVKYNRPLETPLSRFLEGHETKVTESSLEAHLCAPELHMHTVCTDSCLPFLFPTAAIPQRLPGWTD